MNRTLAAALVALFLSACGFHLRAPQPLPFETIYVDVPDYTDFGAALKRSIRTSGHTRVVDSPKEAEATLTVVSETREKSILSLNAAGRVREYQLHYRFVFRVQGKDGRVFLPQSEILLTRDMTYNDAEVLAKEHEEALLYRDMQDDLVQQIMRRMAAAKQEG